MNLNKGFHKIIHSLPNYYKNVIYMKKNPKYLTTFCYTLIGQDLYYLQKD